MTDERVSVAIYARYSTDRQDARSIDDQIRRCRAFAASRSLEVAAEYKDAAQSGAHLERADMQRMLAAARRGRLSPFRAVLVDDLSRLSRDLGNTWRIVFEDLAAADVRVIDCNTGMASDGAGARLTFGALALVNDAFLQLVKTETHRGLEGRALAGFWTGGRVFGYRTEIEPNPPDPEHPRKVLRVEPPEAAIVRRVFEQYAHGASTKPIAEQLNTEGIRAPYDGDYTKAAGRGWGHTTIRAMLRNERYVGRFVWNRRKWVRSARTGNRVHRLRPPEEHVEHRLPELAIVSDELWARVQARVSANRKAGGRPAGASKHPLLLSGLLRCGTCGASMVVVGAKVKNGRRYPTYGCAARHSKGSAICGNALTISEGKLSRAIFAALHELLASHDFRQRFADRFARRVAARKPAGAEERASLAAEVNSQEARLRRVTEAFATVGQSEALVAQLRREEARLRDLRNRLAAAEQDARPAPTAITVNPEKLAKYLRHVEKLAEEAPESARAALARVLAPVMLHPVEKNGKRSYEARGALKIEDPVSLSGDRVLDKVGCGGRI
ncbi:MAG TPA: recombinase family protein [Anaeromyxobacter sp.]